VLGAAGDPALHGQEAVPTAQRQPAPPLRGGELEPAVQGDRVVDRGHHRDPGAPRVTPQRQHPVAERLVVVHHVEVEQPAAQHPGGAEAEGERLGEARGPHHRHLERVHRVPDLVAARGPERVRLAVQVQARHLGQPHPGVQLRVGLPGEHLDPVAEGGQLAAEVAHVHALAAAVRLAAVRQQRDAHARPPVSGRVPPRID